MCLLCDDEKAYQAYMNYLDAMERQGKAADPDKAMDAVLDQLLKRVVERGGRDVHDLGQHVGDEAATHDRAGSGDRLGIGGPAAEAVEDRVLDRGRHGRLADGAPGTGA